MLLDFRVNTITGCGGLMNKMLSIAVSACLLVAAGAAIRAVSAQDSTQQPGQPTQARVWIQNRGDVEAVPVSIQNIASAVPLRVEVTGVPIVAIGAGSVVEARGTRQPWEYRDVRLAAGQSPSAVLNGAGADGWEATGIVVAEQGGTIVVMKRPR
jgi:hypothetical protein